MGFNDVSPSSISWQSSSSEFSKQPIAVPVITASGTSIFACSKAFSDDNKELFMILPMRRASIGFTYLRISANSSSAVISTLERIWISSVEGERVVPAVGESENNSEVSLPPKPKELHRTC